MLANIGNIIYFENIVYIHMEYDSHVDNMLCI